MPEKKKQYFDTKYVVQMQQGDQEAFNVIFSYYKNHVYWMGINFFSNEEMAKDLVQSVFLEIYQTIKNLKEPEKFYVWMNRIAYTRCLQMIRYNKKDSLYYTKEMGENYTEEFLSDDKDGDVLTIVQKEQVKQIIIDTLETLSPEHRTICYLRLFEELTWPQISDITKIPVGTVSSYMVRIKPMLKRALEKQGFTSASCLSLLLLPNIVEYFKAFIDLKEPLSAVGANQILHNIEQTGANLPTKASWQISAYAYIGIALVLPLIISFFSRPNAPNPLVVDQFVEAVIEEVIYPTQLTNIPFKLEVITSNNNYDQMLLNDQADLTVSWNGDYTLSLLKDGEEIDTKSFTISNLDRDIPIVTNEIFKDKVITIDIDDEDSEIDFEHIEFYENGIISNNFELNREKKEVYITYGVADDNILTVPDIVGNILEVRISFYEVNAVE